MLSPVVKFFLMVTLLFIVEAKKTQSTKSDDRTEFYLPKKPTHNKPLYGQYSFNSENTKEENSLNALIGRIFGAYHKELVPKRPTTVRLDLLLIKVKSTNEREGVFESVVALLMEWQDKRLSWDPLQYGNVTVLAFDSDRVWLPDIAMTNSADHLYSISKDTRFVVRVNYDGTMKFVPTGTARTWCDLKLLTFPFDVQTCSYEFESWSMDSSTMTINVTSSAVVDESFSSPQWALCDFSSIVYEHHYEFSGEIFSRLRFDFVVRRKTTFYLINLIFPCATLSMIQLMVFLIPSTDATSDRVSFGTTNLLTLVVFQTIVTEEMPKSSDSVTALSKYIIALIVVSAVGIFESVAAERLLRARATPPPRWLLKLNVPLLWESQLPSGISGMMLQAWSAGKNLSKDMKMNRPAVIKKKNKKSQTSKKSASPPPNYYNNNNNNKPSVHFYSPSATQCSLLTEESEFQVECFCKRNKLKDVSQKSAFKMEKTEEIIEFLPPGKAVCLESSEGYTYETKIRSSNTPSPMFTTPQGLVRFQPIHPANGKVRRDSLDSLSSEIITLTTPSITTEADLIEIGKMWGAIVTRLDGFTFTCCTLCVILLPALLFLPVALEGETCQKIN